MQWVPAVLAALFLAVLILMHRRTRARIKAERASLFEPALSLFERYRIEQDDVNFPVLKGRYRGYEVKLEPIVDHIAMRKLPSLWLLATVRSDLPLAGVLDLLARPLNTEFFSPASSLEHRLKTPAGFPREVEARTDRPDALPPEAVVAAQADLFEDRRMKELVITPKGVRLVYQLAEGERPYYMVLRQIEFGQAVQLEPALARRLLDRAIALIEELRRGSPVDAGADHRRQEDHDEATAIQA
jgi:hypothetical protein